MGIKFERTPAGSQNLRLHASLGFYSLLRVTYTVPDGLGSVTGRRMCLEPLFSGELKKLLMYISLQFLKARFLGPTSDLHRTPSWAPGTCVSCGVCWRGVCFQHVIDSLSGGPQPTDPELRLSDRPTWKKRQHLPVRRNKTPRLRSRTPSPTCATPGNT